MDIFFSGSIRGGRSDVDVYATLIDILERHGTVLTEHIGTEGVEADEAAAGLTDTDIYEQDLAWLQQADVVVAEVTTPSLGVGYEIGRAVARETPVLCLYRPGAEHELSAMIRGNDAVEVTEYRTPSAVEPVLEAFVRRHREARDRR
ncbi:nucleoside 2-deoxyribosyltransferase [Natronorubrum sp. JWXQ-INN-674]|uniref:Putative 2'-deoxynucleoside 5'-phosphate N-hydrolase 1 n=1 Tax=Natronorubrum halalkaliphilum TaxID=2691917 RepID=A0A6B0VGK2_9EURY|nr:nucleoside 2-deoxyribosyltransferase [Natronorubrum halalkaliphilum]MXV60921.1 nucleoside 2-deoxyribosyltransferase [Natronorubrum halalkaliphilum]